MEEKGVKTIKKETKQLPMKTVVITFVTRHATRHAIQKTLLHNIEKDQKNIEQTRNKNHFDNEK